MSDYRLSCLRECLELVLLTLLLLMYLFFYGVMVIANDRLLIKCSYFVNENSQFSPGAHTLCAHFTGV